MNRPLIATLCAALTLGAATVPAQAEEIKVAYADLNLTTAAGQKALEARIDRAAKAVCKYDDLYTGSRLMSREIESCYQQAKKSATVQMASVVVDVHYGG